MLIDFFLDINHTLQGKYIIQAIAPGLQIFDLIHLDFGCVDGFLQCRLYI